MKFWRKLIPMFLILGMAMIWNGDLPQAQVCKPKGAQPELQYLRRLSLDLRGYLPTVAEMQSVLKEGEVSSKTLLGMINSDALQTQLNNYHRDLLWQNISNIRLANNSWRLGGNGTSVPYYLVSTGRRRNYRGYTLRCLNKPAEYNKDGSIKTTDSKYKAPNDVVYNVRQEGYVKVRPYWDPSKEVKVCAFDASELLQVKGSNGRTYDCSRSAYLSPTNGACGCGPNLRWCMPNFVQYQILRSLTEQTQRFLTSIIKSRRPYTEAITGKSIELNGPISHFFRHQTAGSISYSTPEQNHEIPNIPYQEVNTWKKVTREKLHAGILTMPLFLLKFSSDRGRATRFYNAFLCTHFQAPPGGLPPASDNCHDEPNLMKRCGCKYCHQTVEPAAAYWGRWAESGMAVLNSEKYPRISSFCKKIQNRYNATCRRFYFYPNDDKEMQYLGYLRSYVFSTPSMGDNIEKGPISLAQKSIDDGSFATCTTRRMWTWFVGKAPHAQQETQILELASQFKKNKYDLLKLIQAIVSTPEYRQGRLLNR